MNLIFNPKIIRGKRGRGAVGKTFVFGLLQKRLAKFNGLTDKEFILHLKESELRFNNRKINLYKILLKIIRENPL